MLARVFAWAFLISASMVSFGVIGAVAGMSWGTAIFDLAKPVIIKTNELRTDIPPPSDKSKIVQEPNILPEVSSEPYNTSDWETYRNEWLGFEFRYPKNCKLVKNFPKDKPKEFYYIRVSCSENSFFDVLPYGEVGIDYMGIDTKRHQELIAGKDTEVWGWFLWPAPAPGPARYHKKVFFRDRGSFQIWMIRVFEPYTELFGELDSILSTFQFIESSVTSTWKPYLLDNFQFFYPGNWKLEEFRDDRVGFIDENGKEVATAVCPIIETGYEVWDFTRENRQYEKDGVQYEIRFFYGTPTYENGQNIAVIFMYPKETQGLGGTSGTCQITSGSAVQDVFYETFKKIYDLVQ